MLRKTMGGLLLALPLAATAAPVVKPGLWKSEQTLNGERSTEHDCVTPEDARSANNFVKDLPKDCTLSKVRDDARVLAYDYQCQSAEQSGKGQVEIKVDAPTHYVMRYRFDGQTRIGKDVTPIRLDLQAESRWVAADCGEYGEAAAGGAAGDE
ncbi:DUF3617 domain-containing protein [Solimonas variicoloris]|uniref:DUF3617 domain-containing protein n=1 Tax=Solimonas variicoloris TaxID=254408 RepID=UPI00146A69DF|nr:DUF3617 family protein [Solimonas variicoloris]